MFDKEKYTAYIKRAYCLDDNLKTLEELIAKYGCCVCNFWDDISCYCRFCENNGCPYDIESTF